MSKKQSDFPVGVKVRVGRDSCHGIKFGGVCTVVDNTDFLGDVLVKGPVSPDWDSEQYVDPTNLKLAKQANKRSK